MMPILGYLERGLGSSAKSDWYHWLPGIFSSGSLDETGILAGVSLGWPWLFKELLKPIPEVGQEQVI